VKREGWQEFVNLLTVGVARQQRHFLCSDKENEAKESLLLAEGYVVHGAAATAIQ
jgi:hypothetical protein